MPSFSNDPFQYLRRRAIGAIAGGGGSAAVASAAVFDAANKSTDFALSNGNLTATRSSSAGGSFANAKATNPKTSGSWHVEFTVAAAPGNFITLGVALSGFSNTATTQASGAGVYKSDGSAIVDGVSYGVVGDAFTVGDTVAIEYNATAGSFWFQKSGGTGRKGPYAISSGSGVVPLVGLDNGASTVGNSITINAGQSAFAIAPTGGFLAWA